MIVHIKFHHFRISEITTVGLEAFMTNKIKLTNRITHNKTFKLIFMYFIFTWINYLFFFCYRLLVTKIFLKEIHTWNNGFDFLMPISQPLMSAKLCFACWVFFTFTFQIFKGLLWYGTHTHDNGILQPNLVSWNFLIFGYSFYGCDEKYYIMNFVRAEKK